PWCVRYLLAQHSHCVPTHPEIVPGRGLGYAARKNFLEACHGKKPEQFKRVYLRFHRLGIWL
ncbi:hypothetical protein, partial [Streptomyces sp. CHA3]|uniref:hypothetical protein n=1 Tax=Streptomyces sp. CHA3 TaxID=2841669 RepID=UPI002094CC7B